MHDNDQHRLFGILIVAAACFTFSQSVVANDSEVAESGSTDAPPRNRLDLSAVFLDGDSTDSISGLLGYTYTLRRAKL